MPINIPNVSPIDLVYFIGVDLGQRGSHTAFVTLERFDEQPPFTDLLRGAQLRTRYVIRQIHRVPLGTPYSTAIASLKTLAEKLSSRGTCIIVIDESGCGIPIVELLKKELAGLSRIVALTITSGQTATPSTVPRAALITKMQVMAERGELEIAPHCRDLDALKYELTHLTVTKTAELDDLALALCLACWRAKIR